MEILPLILEELHLVELVTARVQRVARVALKYDEWRITLLVCPLQDIAELSQLIRYGVETCTREIPISVNFHRGALVATATGVLLLEVLIRRRSIRIRVAQLLALQQGRLAPL